MHKSVPGYAVTSLQVFGHVFETLGHFMYLGTQQSFSISTWTHGRWHVVGVQSDNIEVQYKDCGGRSKLQGQPSMCWFGCQSCSSFLPSNLECSNVLRPHLQVHQWIYVVHMYYVVHSALNIHSKRCLGPRLTMMPQSRHPPSSPVPIAECSNSSLSPPTYLGTQ